MERDGDVFEVYTAAKMGLLAFPEMQETARLALRAITLQDLGARPKAWDKWWQRAKKRSRLDWLIEGLASEELELRAAAHRELADLAGDDFGYRAWPRARCPLHRPRSPRPTSRTSSSAGGAGTDDATGTAARAVNVERSATHRPMGSASHVVTEGASGPRHAVSIITSAAAMGQACRRGAGRSRDRPWCSASSRRCAKQQFHQAGAVSG